MAERVRNRLDNAAIRGWLRSGKGFEISDGGGLTLAFRSGYKAPVWRLRYRIGGRRGRDGEPGATGIPRVMVLGSYTDISLADARSEAKKLRARVTLGHDVAGEKRDRERAAVAKIEAARNVYTVAHLANDYF